jgi:hypothetical protein
MPEGRQYHVSHDVRNDSQRFLETPCGNGRHSVRHGCTEGIAGTGSTAVTSFTPPLIILFSCSYTFTPHTPYP